MEYASNTLGSISKIIFYLLQDGCILRVVSIRYSRAMLRVVSSRQGRAKNQGLCIGFWMGAGCTMVPIASLLWPLLSIQSKPAVCNEASLKHTRKRKARNFLSQETYVLARSRQRLTF